MNKAVFLDRDGVICEDTDFVTGFDKLKIFPFAKEAIDIIHQKGYLAIVISNQSGIARGYMTEDTVRKINDYIMLQTGVDAAYYCPHLPPDEELIPPYRIVCNCRKPKPGMILRAAKEWDVDFSASFMAGDRLTDLEAGRYAGTKTIGISDDSDVFPMADGVFKNLLEFAKVL